MNDKNGVKVTRGTRVMMSFEAGYDRIEWTGKVVGKSPIDGRIKVKPEIMTHRSAGHFLPEQMTKLVDQAGPSVYREVNADGQGRGYTIVRVFEPTVADFAALRSLSIALDAFSGLDRSAAVGRLAAIAF